MNPENKEKFRQSILLIIIAFSSVVIRILTHYRFNQSALLYVGIPFVISIVLIWLYKPNREASWKRKYLNHFMAALIIMLGSSVILFEGFLCVIMFMPIYFGVMLLTFTLHLLTKKYKNRKGSQLFSHILPLLIFISAFEGTTPELSVNRENKVQVTKVINAGIDEIRNQLSQPPNLQVARPWFLELFPMPYKVEANSLQLGDVHKILFRYHRWFVANTHKGSMFLKVDKLEDSIIRSTIIKDTSYIANYLKLNSFEIQLERIDATHTQVSFSIEYKRLLDPAWYFDPLQEYGITKSAEFIIAEVLTPYGK